MFVGEQLTPLPLQVVQARPIRTVVSVETKPPNYVLMSVIVMVGFCFLFGLIALLIGLQVSLSVHPPPLFHCNPGPHSWPVCTCGSLLPTPPLSPHTSHSLLSTPPTLSPYLPLSPLYTSLSLSSPHLSLSLFLSLFLFLSLSLSPLSTVQSDSAWATGDRVRARRLSAAARGWNVSGIVFGVVVWLVVVLTSVTSTAVVD